MSIKKKAAVGVYILGCICVIYLVLLALIGRNHVSNPDAMIPFTDFDRGTICLAIGCIPMVISCIALIKTFGIKDKLKKLLVMIPGIITFIPFVAYGIFLFILLVLAVFDVTMFG